MHSSVVAIPLQCPGRMPEVSRFFGIVIVFYNRDHAPPHFHVRYAGDSGIIQISNFEVLSGELPPRILRLVREWALLNRQELVAAWVKASSNQVPAKIKPLE
jgi:hypothetical protein